MEEKLIITITKKNSLEIVARIFTDETGELKAIVDNEFEIEFVEKTHPAR